MKRQEQRERILQLLYAWEYNREGDGKIEDMIFPFRPQHKITDFMQKMIDGIVANEPFLDEIINKYAVNWEAGKLYLIDKLILRIAIFEMFFVPETPRKVIINEALELAKGFSSEKSCSFINGILDQIYSREMGRKNEAN
jgi:transcription antitermination factor NusB